MVDGCSIEGKVGSRMYSGNCYAGLWYNGQAFRFGYGCVVCFFGRWAIFVHIMSNDTGVEVRQDMGTPGSG